MINCRGETDSKFAANAGFPFDTAPLTLAVFTDTIKETSLPDLTPYANVSHRAELKAELISKWNVLG
jgi:hypothetical protein